MSIVEASLLRFLSRIRFHKPSNEDWAIRKEMHANDSQQFVTERALDVYDFDVFLLQRTIVEKRQTSLD